MSGADRQSHWDDVYRSKGEAGVSWFQESPEPSLRLILETGAGPGSALIDIGGGASRLVDALLARGFEHVTVLDLSGTGLDEAKSRLGPQAARVAWVVADVTAWEPSTLYDIWHDRAAFHFLTDETDRARYVDCLRRALRPGGHAIIGTFAPEGPEKCSGLPVVRHDAATLRQALGSGFDLVHTERHVHRTPWGTPQPFQFSVFRRHD